GDRSRALWAPKALALSSRPLHPSLDPLCQLPFLKLRPSDGDVVHGLTYRRSGVDPGLLQGADLASTCTQRRRVLSPSTTDRNARFSFDNQVGFAAQSEIVKSTPFAPPTQVLGPGLVDELAQ